MYIILKKHVSYGIPVATTYERIFASKDLTAIEKRLEKMVQQCEDLNKISVMKEMDMDVICSVYEPGDEE